MHTYLAHELRDCFLKGEYSAEQIVDHYLKRIATLNPKIGAFLSVLEERARAKAKELDRKRQQGAPLGKLAGIPIAIKDNMHIEGEITTCGSKFLTNYVAPFSATVTQLLEEDDAILIGKTNLDEFAMGSSTENSALMKTFNPWDLSCVPGGSSGGSTVAISARLCSCALGSDTGGSIRQPASLCGIVGFKPTYGRVSRYGLVAFGSSLDQIGPLTTNVADAALMMEVIGKQCLKDSTSLPLPSGSYFEQLKTSLKGKRIGVPWKFLDQLNEESKKLFQESLEVFKSMDVEIVEVDLDILRYAIAIYYIISTAEASTNLARFDGIRYGQRSLKAKTLDEVYDFSKEEGFGAEVKRRILLGTFVLSAGYQDAFYKKGQKIRTLMIQAFEEAFKQCDIIGLPTTPSGAFEFGAKKDPLAMYLEDLYTVSANLTGIPAMSIPNGFTAKGLPIGLQLLGPQKEDLHVLQFGHAYQSVTDFHKKMPGLIASEEAS